MIRLRRATGSGVRRVLLWLVPVTLLACAVALRGDLDETGAPRSPEPPRPTVNHELHLGRDLVCSDCHDPKNTGAPAMPDSATCFECHEDLAKEPERVRSYFDAVKQEDGTYKFSRPAYMGDLIMSHKAHADSKVECVSCHGAPSARAFARPEPMEFMNACIACHERKGPESTTCATCHRETSKTTKPPSHAALGFRSVHGKSVPKGWAKGEGGQCALCHQVPKDCTTCHSQTKPQSHVEVGWKRYHGRGELLGREHAFKDLSCALCHKEKSCSACHQTEKPRSHTDAWVRQYHGVQVDLDRNSCTTCHKQDFCASCHQSTEPVSHRGNWDDAHCLNCHEPLQSNSCFACHKNTLGHLAAPPKPGNAAHAGAVDSTGCLTCHTVLPHFDSGGRCGTCHR